jgi:hypothetical protein
MSAMNQHPPAAAAPRQRGAGLLLRLYPAAWRARYQDELEAVLEQHTITIATIVDLLWGALDARLDPAFTSERMFRPMSRLRASAVALFLTFAAFILGYGAFTRLTDPRTPFLDAAQAHPELLTALNVIADATALGLLALALGGVPIVLDIAWRAWRERAWRTLVFLALPVALLAVAGAFGYFANNNLLTYHRNGYVIGTSGDIAVLIIAGALAFGAGLVATVVVGWTVARSQISLGVLRYARWPALLLTLSMATATGALIYWGAQSFIVSRWLFNGYASACGTACPGGVDYTNQIDIFSLSVVAGWMLLTVVIAAVYLARGFRTPPSAQSASLPDTPAPAPAHA